MQTELNTTQELTLQNSWCQCYQKHNCYHFVPRTIVASVCRIQPPPTSRVNKHRTRVKPRRATTNTKVAHKHVDATAHPECILALGCVPLTGGRHDPQEYNVFMSQVGFTE